MDVLDAIRSRRSVRGFLSEPVPHDVLVQLFASAQRAPSWCNTQPWRVWVTSGETTLRLREALLADCDRNPHGESQVPFPAAYPEPYGTHRRECAKALYTAMGIARDDQAARFDAFRANYRGFGAPHIAMIAFDPQFGVYGALDVGCYLQTVLLAAHSLGLATCPQAALASFPHGARRVLPIPESLTLLCGIAIGYEDQAVRANACRTARSELSANVTFC
jgi:nitroreductase